MTDNQCYYTESDLPESWERMATFASQGRCSWTKIKAFPDNREISILCCLSPACAHKNELCELASNAAVFMGRTTRRRGIGLAVQVIPEPEDTIYLRASPRKLIWVDPYTGHWFGGNRTLPGKEIDHVIGADDYSGVEIRLRCYAVCDVTSKQTTITALRGSEIWDLDSREDALHIEVTGVPR